MAGGHEPEQSGFAVVRQSESCSRLSLGAMRETISGLNRVAQQVGCVVFPAESDHDNVLVIFAGAGGVLFNDLTLAVGMPCEVIYFQDCFSAWYQGSQLLPSVAEIATGFLRGQAGDRRPLFFGQSSGAYASLVAGRHFDPSVTIAVSPQVFSDGHVKSRITVIGDIRLYATLEELVDIPEHWRDAGPRQFAGIINSASEWLNPVGSHLWMDHLHLMRLAENELFRLYLMPTGQHNILQGRARAFSGLLSEAVAKPAENMHDFLVQRLAEIAGLASSPG